VGLRLLVVLLVGSGLHVTSCQHHRPSPTASLPHTHFSPLPPQVILFTDVLDEYTMQHLLEFDDKKFANVSKENLKLGDKDEEERKEFKELKKEMKPLTEWWKALLGGWHCWCGMTRCAADGALL
jgi:HSP90 family molecular chaperone